jgi:hypothetical protein
MQMMIVCSDAKLVGWSSEVSMVVKVRLRPLLNTISPSYSLPTTAVSVIVYFSGVGLESRADLSAIVLARTGGMRR